MRASDLDFRKIKHFHEGEFPALNVQDGTISVLQLVDARVVQQLDELREQFGSPVIPSPVTGAWAREGGSRTSQHYVGPLRRTSDGDIQPQRLATAGDFFPMGDIRRAFLVATSLHGVNGIGVYLDTQYGGTPRPMMHIDVRPGPRQVWLRDGDGMLYPMRGEREMRAFWRKLSAW